MKLLNKNKNRGAVLIELAIIVPLLLFFGIAGFEFSRALKYLKIGANLSREMANVVYRECSDNSDIQMCLDGARNNLETIAQSLVPNIQINAAIYKGTTTKIGGSNLCNNSPTSTFSSMPSYGPSHPRASVTQSIRIAPATINDLMSRCHGTVVIAEAYVPFSPLFPFFGYLIPGTQAGSSSLGIDLYDVTVI